MTDRDQRNDDPFRINLEQQKKRSKDLLKGLKAGDPAAAERYRRHHPKARDMTAGAIIGHLARLTDAQLVVARELRLPSWPALKAHVAEMETSRSAMENDRNRKLDRDAPTLHIRCGSDIKNALNAAGFAGDFLEYSNPFCQGPVTGDPDWLAQRIAFASRAYGKAGGMTVAGVSRKMEAEEAGLARAAHKYDRIALWFEHDSYDQLILARCLAHFAEHGAPKVLELVSADRFPGSMRFIGIGQLPPEALRLLWAQRQLVAASQFEFGTRVWQALQSPDPTALHEAARTSTPALPQMAGAIRRHLQELPSTANGTALTEQLTLDSLQDGPMPMGRIFRDLMLDKEPLPWLGDLMFFHITKEMLRSKEPAVRADPATAEEDWPRRRIELTDVGRAVLAGERDYLSLGAPERWVGGVRIETGKRCWRWDETEGKPAWR